MFPLLLLFLTFFDGTINLNKIAKENALKKEAETAYSEGKYPEAISKLKTLIEEMGVTDDQAMLNLGHAYFKNKDFENASKNYEKALLSSNKKIKSIASQQLGILSYQSDKDKEKALAFFKEAMRANPENKEAQKNYELLKKAKDENKDNKDKKDDKNQDKKDKKDGDKDDKNKDGKENKDGKGDDKKDGKGDKDNKDGKGDKQDDKDAQNKKDGKGDKDKKDDKDNKDKNGSEKEGDKKEKDEQAKGNKDKNGEKGQNKDDKKDGKEDSNGAAQKEKQGGKKEKDKVVVNPEALAQMGMTEQKAKAILNAMRSNETQYIQQVKREPSKKNKKGKPDW